MSADSRAMNSSGVITRWVRSRGFLMNGKQPWRTICFTLGGLDTIALIGLLIYAMATHGQG